jgi:hypothetical protein
MNRTKMKVTLASALAAVVLAASAAFAAEGPIKASGTLIDAMCGAEATQADADAHTRECALMSHCAASGFGIVLDGKFHKFDADGSKLAAEIFEKTTKKDHITATVEGVEQADGSIKVEKLTAD